MYYKSTTDKKGMGKDSLLCMHVMQQSFQMLSLYQAFIIGYAQKVDKVHMLMCA